MAYFSLTPPAELSPSHWAEQHVSIPVGNARPGLISFEEVAYQRAMLDIAADPEIQRVSLMLGAQTGKTMTSLCLMGYYTLYKPQSQIMMMPSENDLKVWLQTKFNPLVDANAQLKDCYAKPRGREGINNQLMKSFKGGWLMFAWAGSANSARGKSAPVIVCDEVDGYKYTSEGHPVELLWERSATFGEHRLLIEMSTPTIRGRSRIEASFLQGDCRYYFVVCPDCDHKHTITFTEQTVRWDGKDPRSARLHCPECDRPFNDYERVAMIRDAERQGGGWEATRKSAGHASFHLNSLYSPLRRLSDIVAAYQSATDNDSMQSFTNTILAETWEETGEKADHETLYERSEVYDADIPDGVLILTAGADVQADRIEYEIVGWGEGEESWSIDYQVVYGDTTQNSVYLEFFEALRHSYLTKDGQSVSVFACGIDSGYNTSRVYEAMRYCGRNPLLFALKGVGGFDREEVRRTSRARIEHGKWRPDIVSVGTDNVKLTVMRRLNQTTPGPGFCHFPDDRELEYYLQLTSEQWVRTVSGGKRVDRWEKKYERNEAFDCRVYAYATLRILNPKLDPEAGVLTSERKRRARIQIKNPRF